MPLLIDSFNKILSLTSPTTEYDLQTLHDEVQDFLASPLGAIEDGVAAQWDAKGEIFKPEGKIEDPTNPGVFSQIILLLNPEWQIQFWGGSGYTRIFGGKLVGGVGDEPFKATGTAGDITVLESPVDGVTVEVGSGLSTAQDQKLEEIHGQVRREIYIDTSAVPVGNGYQQTPHNTWTAAVDDAEANGIKGLVLLADATVDRQIKNFFIRGVGEPTIDVNGQIWEKNELVDLNITGSISGTDGSHYHHCHIQAGVTGLSGDLHQCGFAGTAALRAGATSSIIDAYSNVAGLSRPTIDVNGGGCAVSIRDYRGGLILAGADNAGDEVTVSMAMGRLQLAADNTDGTISVRGNCEFEDLSAGSTVDTGALFEPNQVREMWKLLGLDDGDKITITPGGVTTEQASFVITFTGDGVTSTTMDRTA
jgi:hypothetical protein